MTTMTEMPEVETREIEAPAPPPPAPEEATTEPETPWMSAECSQLFTALALAQGEIEGALKTGTNDHFKSKYADLEAVWEAIRAPLSRHGLAVIQLMRPTPDGTRLVSVLTHKSGQWVRSEVPVRPEKNSIHAIGSALTYFRRYSLMALVGVSPTDDDGNEAAGMKNGRR